MVGSWSEEQILYDTVSTQLLKERVQRKRAPAASGTHLAEIALTDRSHWMLLLGVALPS